MTDSRRMKLHLGKCIDDLDKLFSVPDLKHRKADTIIKSAIKLLARAEESQANGDEENAYVFYMKYLKVVNFLRKCPDYLGDKKFYNEMLGVHNPMKALKMADSIKMSLLNRYDAERVAAREREKEISTQPPAIMSPQAEPTPTSIYPSPQDSMLTCEELFILLRDQTASSSVLILDTRPEVEYRGSRITHKLCINVPQQIIEPGLTAGVLEKKIDPEARSLWSNRGSMELVVLVDNNSRYVIPSQPLHLLKTILTKWDVKVHYKRVPMALRGGFEEWVLRYPSQVTAPYYPQPALHSLPVPLDDIQYPSDSELSPEPTPQRPVATAGAGAAPRVDRSSKGAALAKYTTEMMRLVKAREGIATGAFEVEAERVRTEREWQSLASDGAYRLDEDQHNLREHELLSRLMQLENRQHDIELENQRLREQLQEHQKRIQENNMMIDDESSSGEEGESGGETGEGEEAGEGGKAAVQDVLARIEVAEKAQAQMNELRAQLEQKRLSILREARNVPKPQYPRPRPEQQQDVPSEEDEIMQRAHSESDLDKKAGGGESVTVERAVPSVDRASKPPPPQPHQRDFQPVYANVARGLTGLKNLGNTCYMNSIVQCLSNTSPLRAYLCAAYRARGGPLTEELAAAVRALTSQQYRFIAPNDLREVVGSVSRVFRSSEQQDAHEFLTIVLDTLHTELGDESVVQRLFHGQQKSTLTCLSCRATSSTSDTFSNLSLELPHLSTRCTLSDCLRLYLGGERVRGWRCSGCKEAVEALKKLDIVRLPRVLILHFKRFHSHCPTSTPAYTKKQTYIDFPLDELDMSQLTGVDYGESGRYRLYAVVNHYGSMEGGHYTATCRDLASESSWHRYDDHLVTPVPSGEVNSSAAYILFYALT